MKPSDPDAAPGLEMQRLMLLAIGTRTMFLVGLQALRAPETRVDAKHAQAAADPTYVEQINAATIVQVFGVIEGFIEGGARSLSELVEERRQAARDGYRRATKEANQASRSRGVTEEGIHALTDLSKRLFDHYFPKPLHRLNKDLPRPERWEDALRGLTLGAPPQRPIPEDMKATLNEVAQIRNVLLHRMGRLDQPALDAVTEGPWMNVGELVRIDTALYRIYIAALFSYADELTDRLLLATGKVPRNPSLDDWRGRVPVGG